MTNKKNQQGINEEISNWRNPENNEPLIIEFDDGTKIIFVKQKEIIAA